MSHQLSQPERRGQREDAEEEDRAHRQWSGAFATLFAPKTHDDQTAHDQGVGLGSGLDWPALRWDKAQAQLGSRQASSQVLHIA